MTLNHQVGEDQNLLRDCWSASAGDPALRRAEDALAQVINRLRFEFLPEKSWPPFSAPSSALEELIEFNFNVPLQLISNFHVKRFKVTAHNDYSKLSVSVRANPSDREDLLKR